jgi:hypothetical protein
VSETLSPEIVELTDHMQRSCVQAYLTVASSLRVGMSETVIAHAVNGELQSQGITDFWYDIPIVVLVGVERFMQSVLADYAVKSPSEQVTLQADTPFFIDIHPRYANGRWGNFAASGIFQPHGDEQVKQLELMQSLHHQGVHQLTAKRTGADVANWFTQQFAAHGIEHVDVRANFGHSMGAGLKSEYQRLFLDEANYTPIGGSIYGIEPGGVRRDHAGQVVAFARFEDCVYIPPDGRPSVMLGAHEPLPIVFS